MTLIYWAKENPEDVLVAINLLAAEFFLILAHPVYKM